MRAAGSLLGAEDVDTLASNSGSPIALTELLLEALGPRVPRGASAEGRRPPRGRAAHAGDRHTIAGRIPGLANGWMIATHSGITLGPLLGRLMADEIVRGTPSPMLAPFRPERFLTAAGVMH